MIISVTLPDLIIALICSAGKKGTTMTQSYSSTSTTSKIENYTNIPPTTLRNETPAANKTEAASTSLISQTEPLTHVLQSIGIINQREFQSSSYPTILPSTKEIQVTKETEAVSINVHAAPTSTKVDVSEGQPNTPNSVSRIMSHFISRLDTTHGTSKWIWTTADDRNSSPQTADLNSYTSSTDSPPNGTKKNVDSSEPDGTKMTSPVASHRMESIDLTRKFE